MEGKVNEQDIFDFLTFLSVKGEASDEIAGGVYILRESPKELMLIIVLILVELVVMV